MSDGSMNFIKIAAAARALIKGSGVLVLFALYCFSASIIMVFFPAAKGGKRACLAKNVSFFSSLLLSLLGIHLSVRHRERLRQCAGNHLIVSNHLSSVDIAVLASLIPSVFVTSVELKNYFPLGLLALLGGSVFVERRSPAGLKKEIKTISNILRMDCSAVLFPEGTTSNGECVRPFKISLMDAAIMAKTDVLPLCLHYRRIDKRNVTAHNRDSILYYGGMPFFRHVLRLLSLKSIDVDVAPLPVISVSASLSRKQLATLTHDAISAAYRGQ